MMRYVNEPVHLMLAMKALRGPKAIQLAVFNVLKVFIPNPYKADGISRILSVNKRTFLAFLDEFEKESEDELLNAHKAEMTNALMALPDVIPNVKKTSVGTQEEAQIQQPSPSQRQQTAQLPTPTSAALPPTNADEELP